MRRDDVVVRDGGRRVGGVDGQRKRRRDDAADAPHRQVPALADAYVVRLGELHPAAQRLERVFVQDALRALGLDALEHGDLLGELVGVEVLGVIVEPQLDADRGVELRLDDVLGRFVRTARSIEGVLRFDHLALDELEVLPELVLHIHRRSLAQGRWAGRAPARTRRLLLLLMLRDGHAGWGHLGRHAGHLMHGDLRRRGRHRGSLRGVRRGCALLRGDLRLGQLLGLGIAAPPAAATATAPLHRLHRGGLLRGDLREREVLPRGSAGVRHVVALAPSSLR